MATIQKFNGFFMKDIDNTMHEEMLDGTTRYLRQQHRLINQELSVYSYTTIRAFVNTIPCNNPKYSLEISPKEYIEEQNIIKERIKNSNEFITEFYTTEYIYISSVEDFWSRWNKFKNLKAFL